MKRVREHFTKYGVLCGQFFDNPLLNEKQQQQQHLKAQLRQDSCYICFLGNWNY